MMKDRLNLDPRLGDAILQLIERQTGRPAHIVLIACPVVDNGRGGQKLGQPDFVTSLRPDEMENLVTQIAGGFVMAGERVVTPS